MSADFAPSNAQTHPLHTLHNSGCRLIPVAPRDKRPTVPDWPNYVASPSDIDQWIESGSSVGILGARHPVIDVDITHPRLNSIIRAVLDDLLNKPLFRVGRAPRAAVICRTAQPFSKIRLAVIQPNGAPSQNDDGKPACVEVLGNGQQAVISGLHPKTDKPYFYERENQRGGLDLLAAQALTEGFPEISAHWVTETLAPALSAALRPSGYRVGVSGSTAPNARQAVSQEALRAPSIEALRECVDLIPNEIHEREGYIRVLIAIKAAAGDRIEDGLAIALQWADRWTGGTNEPARVEHDYRSLRGPFDLGFDFLTTQARAHGYSDADRDFGVIADQPKPKSTATISDVERFNARYAIVRTVSGAILYTPERGPTELIRTSHWRDLTKNEFTTGSDGKRALLSERWLASSERRAYARLVFDPALRPLAPVNGQHGDENFNLYPGLAVAPSPNGACDLFLDHLRTVAANGSEAAYQWVLMWLAALVQQPSRLPGTALVLRGAQGAGKSVVGEVFERLLGPLHVTLSDPGELVGRFNSLHEGKLLIQVEEAFFAGDPRNVGRIKNMITAPKVRIERKGIEPYEISNFARLLITSNEGWVVPAGLGERRFMVLDVNEDRASDRVYHGAMRAQIFENGGAARLLHYLLNEVVIDWDIIGRPLATEALRDQQISSFNADRRWLLDVLMDGAVPGDASGDGTAPADTLYQSYENALRQRGERRTSKEALGKFLRGYGLGRSRRRSGGSRVQFFTFPPLPELRARFARDLALPPDWGDETEWAAADGILGATV